MSSYAQALARYLETENQSELAARIGVQQASISRYKGSKTTEPRLPPRDIAEKIDAATGGQVPLALWIAEATRKFGLAA